MAEGGAGAGGAQATRTIRTPVSDRVAPRIKELVGGMLGETIAEGLRGVEGAAAAQAAAHKEETDGVISAIRVDARGARESAQGALQKAAEAGTAAEAAKAAADGAHQSAATARNEAAATKALLDGVELTQPDGSKLMGLRAFRALSENVAALRGNLDSLAKGMVEETVSCEVDGDDGAKKTLRGRAAVTHILSELKTHTEVLGGLIGEAEGATRKMDEVADKAESALAAATAAQTAAEKASGDAAASLQTLQEAERVVQGNAETHSAELQRVQAEAKAAAGGMEQVRKEFGDLKTKVETALQEMAASIGLLADALLKKGIISKDVADAISEEERRVGE